MCWGPVRYYLIAIQFIIFDLEIIFIVPWATVFRDLGVLGLIEMGIFAGMLLLGFISAGSMTSCVPRVKILFWNKALSPPARIFC